MSGGPFREWREARAYAEKRVRETGIAHGLEWNDYAGGFLVRMVPRPENRAGYELRIEVAEVGHTLIPEALLDT